MIAEIAHEHRGFCAGKSAADSFFDLRQVLGVCFHHGHVGEVLRLAVLRAAIEVELIAPKDGTLHHRLGQVHARRAWKGKALQRRDKRSTPSLTHPFRRDAHRLAHRIQACIPLFPKPHQKHPFGLDLALCVEQDCLLALPLKLTALQEIAQRSMKRFIH